MFKDLKEIKNLNKELKKTHKKKRIEKNQRKILELKFKICNKIFTLKDLTDRCY